MDDLLAKARHQNRAPLSVVRKLAERAHLAPPKDFGVEILPCLGICGGDIRRARGQRVFTCGSTACKRHFKRNQRER